MGQWQAALRTEPQRHAELQPPQPSAVFEVILVVSTLDLLLPQRWRFESDSSVLTSLLLELPREESSPSLNLDTQGAN